MTIELVWEPPPLHSQNGIIRQYSIEYYVSEMRQNVFKQTTDNSTSTIVTDLHPYYTYSFKVAAVTIAVGPQSVPVTARTLEDGNLWCVFIVRRNTIISSACTVPTGVPQSVEAVAVSSTSINVTWNSPLLEEQNGLIRSYHINVSAAEDREVTNFETDGSTTNFVLTSLHPYYLYSIKVSAFTIAIGPYATVEERTRPEG